MNDAERRYRAVEAERLLNEPLLKQVLDDMEQTAIEEMLGDLGQWPDPDVRRRVLADRVNVIRSVRRDLRSMISDGKQAAHQWRPA